MGNVMFKLSYGLFVLSAHCGKKDNACIINTAAQVASSPDRICISVNNANNTCDMLKYSDDFTVSIISENADFSLFKHFGFQSGCDVDKFADFDDCKRVKNGTYAITKGTNGYISAHIDERIDLGSHTLFIATITETGELSDIPSATYTYYQNNIKPKPAPVKKEGKKIWRCRVCGYEYEGDELPAGFICPTCKHGADDFEKQ